MGGNMQFMSARSDVAPVVDIVVWWMEMGGRAHWTDDNDDPIVWHFAASALGAIILKNSLMTRRPPPCVRRVSVEECN